MDQAALALGLALRVDLTDGDHGTEARVQREEVPQIRRLPGTCLDAVDHDGDGAVLADLSDDLIDVRAAQQLEVAPPDVEALQPRRERRAEPLLVADVQDRPRDGVEPACGHRALAAAWRPPEDDHGTVADPQCRVGTHGHGIARQGC